MVTEFCKGSDLRRYLEGRKRPVEESHARRLMYELANALYVLKSNHIIHRDIKPANLLLTSVDLHEAVLKVADFGMAKEATTQRCHELRDDDLEECDLETFLFASELGTPLYMSPERIQRQSYSFKADVYSAGLVLYELMVGRPVKAGSRSHLLTAVPDAIQQERAKYPVSQAPLWLSLVEGMTEPKPARRLSVEQVLRHPWFAVAAVGPALPPLTIPLPATAEVTSGNGASPVVEALAPAGAGAVLTDVSDCDDGVQTAEGKEDAPDTRQASPLWRVLNTDGLQPPSSSGPYIITSAVRNFVDVVVYYVYESEMEDQDALVLLGYLHDTVRHGLKLFERELKNVTASMHTPAPRPTSAAAVAVGTTADALPAAKSEPHSLPRAYQLTKAWKRLFRRLRALTGERRWLCESQGKPSQQLLDRSSSDSDEDPTAAPPLSAEMLIFRRACKLIEADAVAELTQCSRERRGYAKATALLRVLLHQAVITVPDIGEAAAASTVPPHALCLVELPTQRTSGGVASRVLNKLLAHLQACPADVDSFSN